MQGCEFAGRLTLCFNFDTPFPQACKDTNIRVSVVGVAAEVYVCRRLADDTGGTYRIALNESHLEELLMAHAAPPPATGARATAQLVRA